ncbi:kDa basic [Brachionus plicatilis]|uniref:ATP synthase F(0) complex subunit e, mitochondrial n=1 Tax=Brachionus plicatilis TaxID=10195 RepID=A0A3M7PJL5_BRAPC|nr:kDa basic [Brachionus plicatilis]
MSDALAAPKNISPLIRAGRWAFLLAGIYYGHNKLQSLRIQDEPLRKAAIEKATREHHQQLLEKEANNKQGMIDLAKAAGVQVKN